MKPRFAELFAGAGGLTMGLERAGWESAWHAEIADAPRAILAHHWPSVPLLGDVTTLDGKALTALHGPIDLLCGGSPCQDLSVAGKRAGMTEGSGTRSSLFYEQMRLWDETGADLCLWENVDGARSSSNGKDFGEVLRAFVGAAVPVPSDGWRSAGVAAGPRGVAAWRVLDAQYFGVPQRRRRVFVLGTRTGSVDPAQVLSLAESLRGDTPQSREAGEGAAEGADGGIDIEGGVAAWDGLNHTLSGVMHTLRAKPIGAGASFGGVMAFSQNQVGDVLSGDVMHALSTNSNPTGRNAPNVLAIDLAQVTSKANRSQPQPQPLSPTLNGHGDVIAFGAQNSAAQGASASAKCTPSLDRSKVPAVVAVRTAQTSANGHGISDVAHTLDGAQGQAICGTGEVTHALTHEGADASEDGTGRGTPIVAGALCARERGGGFPGTDGALDGHVVANTIMAREAKGWNPARDIGNGTVTAGIPRRLTPRECERLMGWEDDHTLVPDAKGKLLSDAARYKACGNGVASPVAHWIGGRLAAALAESQPNPSSHRAVNNAVSGASLDGPEGPEFLAVITRRSTGKTLVVVKRGEMSTRGVIDTPIRSASAPTADFDNE